MYLENDGYINLDIMFCDNAGCPFKDCQRHTENLRGRPNAIISIAQLGGVCKKYLGWLVDRELEGEIGW